MIAGERQSVRLRKEYFKALLRQEIGWFDMCNPNELASKVATECENIQGAITEKVPIFAMTICTTLGGFAVGYIRGWKMSLVVTAALPAIAMCMSFIMYYMSTKTKMQ